ncbi:MAG: hypothetical protein WKF34_00360 [Pyrinomonadaceae bacterium]
MDLTPEQMRQFYDDNFYLILFAGMGLGLLLGLLPLIFGFRRRHRNLGIAGLVASAAAGAVSPLLSLLTAVVFLVVILTRPIAAPSHPADPAA